MKTIIPTLPAKEKEKNAKKPDIDMKRAITCCKDGKKAEFPGPKCPEGWTQC